MSKTCKSCGTEKLTEKERILKHLDDIMNGKGHAHFYNTLQGLEPSDYLHDETTRAEEQALRDACNEYDEAIGAAFTAFGKVLVAAGIPLDEAKDWVGGHCGNEDELDDVRIELAKTRLGAK